MSEVVGGVERIADIDVRVMFGYEQFFFGGLVKRRAVSERCVEVGVLCV